MAALLVLAALTFLTAASFSLRYPELFVYLWELQYWPARLFTAAVAYPAVAIVLFLQYSRRTVVLSRALLAGVVVIAVMIATLTPRDQEFAVQAMLSGRQSNPAVGVVSTRERSAANPLYRRGADPPLFCGIPVRSVVPAGLDVLTGNRGNDLGLRASILKCELPGKTLTSIGIVTRFDGQTCSRGSGRLHQGYAVRTADPACTNFQWQWFRQDGLRDRLDSGSATIECYTPFPGPPWLCSFRRWAVADRPTTCSHRPQRSRRIERHRSGGRILIGRTEQSPPGRRTACRAHPASGQFEKHQDR
jgi:hypothetical protein